jgi:hypothetical protein
MGRVAAGVAGIVLVLLVAAQLILPRIAEHVARERAGRYGTVLGVHVSAFPAVQLLWEHAQSASLRYGSASMSQQQAVDQLVQARGIDRLDVTAASLQVGMVRLEDVVMHKRGDAVAVVGTVGEGSLRASLPAGMELQGATVAGGSLEVRAGAEVFGARVSVQTRVMVAEGAIVVEPQGLPLGGLARVTVFSDPRLNVEGLTFAPVAGGREATWRASLRARLVGS